MNYNNFKLSPAYNIYKPKEDSLLDSATLDERLKEINSGSEFIMKYNSPVGVTPDKYKALNNNSTAPDNNQQPYVDADVLDSYAKQGAWVGNALGDIIALTYAFKTKSGFWKGFGYVLLGGLTGGALGFGVGSLIKKK